MNTTKKFFATALLATALVSLTPAVAQARPGYEPNPSAADLGPDRSTGLRHAGVIHSPSWFQSIFTW